MEVSRAREALQRGANRGQAAGGGEAAGAGLTIPQLCKKLGISDQTFYRWRIKFGLKEDEARRLKALEQENARLKKIVAEQALDISLLKDSQRGNGEPGRWALRDPDRAHIGADHLLACAWPAASQPC
jgi:putative transposase